MSAVDLEVCARLLVEADEDDARMPSQPWYATDQGRIYVRADGISTTVCSVWRGAEKTTIGSAMARQRNNLRAVADQLKAALARIAALDADLHAARETSAQHQRDFIGAAEQATELGVRVRALEGGENRAIASGETAVAPCLDNSPAWFKGRWRDWHRGHGCDKDDGYPPTPEGAAEIQTGKRERR